ncbi:M16 family metallopeptidase [Sphingomonas psychrotolerans]|uniref:Insulinase family protein n=1 Tax=Sphingomonas psychrotolerans TaxID=1327635 RepID=A0A2K8MDK9_9SPHN|nr:pitrilysin family protein [Sphingomonas psychrotolerans]ATY31982.1 insulinase family protein [Sphingomonas psychrotolerans]
MKRALLAHLLAFAVVTPALAQDFPPPPPVGEPKPFKLPATESFTLPNGMQVTLVPYGIAPKAVVSLRVRAGNVSEGETTWLADLTAATMKEGAAGRSAGQLATAAADMGGDLGVSAGQQTTQITMNILSEFAPAAVALIGDVAIRPDLPPGELARVKANLGRQLSVGLSQPGTLADIALARTIYGPNHPYGRVVPSQAQLAGYTIDQVKGFHRDQFGAKRAHLYVAGKFDAAAVKAAITRTFGGWAAGPEPLTLAAPHQPGPRVILIDRPDAPQTTLRLSFDAAVAGSAADIPQRVTNSLLGGAFSSRITTNIRETKGYTYSPGSGVAFNPGDALWTFDADVTTNVTGAALTEVFKEIRRMQNEPAPIEESKGIRTYMAGLFAISNSTSPSLVNTLATRDLLGLPADWTDRYVPAVLAVSPEAMQASAKASYPLEKLVLVAVGDLKTVEPQLKALPELANVPFQRVSVP